MSSSAHPDGPLRSAVVIRVEEALCHVTGERGLTSARYAPHFPSPRVERVSPGQVVALATAPDGADVVLWRWYDAVVVGEDVDGVRLWESAHGEVIAARRNSGTRYAPGTRAYLSAGLPGADWWVAGRVGGVIDVELDEVAALYTENGLWESSLRERGDTS